MFVSAPVEQPQVLNVDVSQRHKIARRRSSSPYRRRNVAVIQSVMLGTQVLTTGTPEVQLDVHIVSAGVEPYCHAETDCLQYESLALKRQLLQGRLESRSIKKRRLTAASVAPTVGSTEASQKPASWLDALACYDVPIHVVTRCAIPPEYRLLPRFVADMAEHDIPVDRASLLLRSVSGRDHTGHRRVASVLSKSEQHTKNMIVFMRSQLQDLKYFSGRGTLDVLSLNPQFAHHFKQWNYTMALCEHHFHVGLLHRPSFLQFLVEFVAQDAGPCSLLRQSLLLPVVAVLLPFICQERGRVDTLRKCCAQQEFAPPVLGLKAEVAALWRHIDLCIQTHGDTRLSGLSVMCSPVSFAGLACPLVRSTQVICLLEAMVGDDSAQARAAHLGRVQDLFETSQGNVHVDMLYMCIGHCVSCDDSRSVGLVCCVTQILSHLWWECHVDMLACVEHMCGSAPTPPARAQASASSAVLVLTLLHLYDAVPHKRRRLCEVFLSFIRVGLLSASDCARELAKRGCAPHVYRHLLSGLFAFASDRKLVFQSPLLWKENETLRKVAFYHAVRVSRGSHRSLDFIENAFGRMDGEVAQMSTLDLRACHTFLDVVKLLPSSCACHVLFWLSKGVFHVLEASSLSDNQKDDVHWLVDGLIASGQHIGEGVFLFWLISRIVQPTVFLSSRMHVSDAVNESVRHAARFLRMTDSSSFEASLAVSGRTNVWKQHSMRNSDAVGELLAAPCHTGFLVSSFMDNPTWERDCLPGVIAAINQPGALTLQTIHILESVCCTPRILPTILGAIRALVSHVMECPSGVDPQRELKMMRCIRSMLLSVLCSYKHKNTDTVSTVLDSLIMALVHILVHGSDLDTFRAGLFVFQLAIRCLRSLCPSAVFRTLSNVTALFKGRSKFARVVTLSRITAAHMQVPSEQVSPNLWEAVDGRSLHLSDKLVY